MTSRTFSSITADSRRLTETGWVTESTQGESASAYTAKVLDYLRLAHAADDRPRSANAAISRIGGKRAPLLKAWGELLKAGAIRLHSGGGFYAA